MPAGFAVDVHGVDEAGRSACELAEDLRAARSSWDGATSDGANACGMDIVRAAYTKMQDAWFDEIGVHITILEQTCETLRDTARDSAGIDEGIERGFAGGHHVQ